MGTEKTKEIRKEFCSIKGWNYLEFDCLEDAEEYIIFLESKVNNSVLDGVNMSEIRAKIEEYLLKEVWCCDKEDLGKVELFDLKEKVDSEMELIQWFHSR